MRAVAATLALVLALSPRVRADAPAPAPEPVPPVHSSTAPAPPSYARLDWVQMSPQGAATSTPGFWFTADQILRADARLKYLEDTAAKQCFDATVAEDKKILTGSLSWIWWLAGGVAVGVAGGAYVRQRAQKGW